MILLQGFHQEVEQGRLVVSAKETESFIKNNAYFFTLRPMQNMLLSVEG
jgi:hypothetical protein